MSDIRPLLPTDTPRALNTAARAFADDPLFAHIFPDPATRIRRFEIENAAYLKWIYHPIGLAEMAGEADGIALWLPPGVFHELGWREIACLPTLARAVGLRRVPLVWRAYKAFDPFFPDVPFWYLGLLAVAPEAQGRGVGSALLRAGLARADRQHVGTYLETSTPENIRFYERHGFEVRDEIPLPDGGPTHWSMWRKPAT